MLTKQVIRLGLRAKYYFVSTECESDAKQMTPRNSSGNVVRIDVKSVKPGELQGIEHNKFQDYDPGSKDSNRNWKQEPMSRNIAS